METPSHYGAAEPATHPLITSTHREYEVEDISARTSSRRRAIGLGAVAVVMGFTGVAAMMRIRDSPAAAASAMLRSETEAAEARTWFEHERAEQAMADADDSSSFSRTVYFQDNEVILEYILEASGASSLEELEQDYDYYMSFVPKAVTVSGNLDLINPDGDYPDVNETYVAFDLQCKNCDAGNGAMSFLMVINLLGDIQGVYPHNETLSVDALHASPVSSKELYLGMNKDSLENGPAATWNWGKNEYYQYPWGWTGNSHDVQWADQNYLWHVPAASDFQLRLMDLGSGDEVTHINVSGGVLPQAWVEKSTSMVDINHFQFDDDNKIAYMSFRHLNAFIKTSEFELDTEDTSGTTVGVEWIVGSHNGTFTLIDIDGTEYKPGTPEYNQLYDGLGSMWAGQHNLEFFGDDEFMMFDNAYDMENDKFANPSGSRLLIVKVDEEAETATLVWEYQFGYNTTIYGDNDQLPSGNLLGCAWPDKSSIGRSESTFDAEIVEVTRETGEIAWRMEVIGSGERASQPSDTYGWMMYSVERLYESPVILSPNCTTGDSNDTITFNTFNNFKTATAYTGTYVITTSDGDEVSDGSISWKSHWRKTEVQIDTSSGACSGGCEITVTNAVGDVGTNSVTC